MVQFLSIIFFFLDFFNFCWFFQNFSFFCVTLYKRISVFMIQWSDKIVTNIEIHVRPKTPQLILFPVNTADKVLLLGHV